MQDFIIFIIVTLIVMAAIFPLPKVEETAWVTKLCERTTIILLIFTSIVAVSAAILLIVQSISILRQFIH